MNRVATITVPCLPCENIDATLAFWEILGFTVTYRQKTPYTWCVVHYEDYDFHFYGLPSLPPEANHATCLVVVPEVEKLHAVFAERLRAALGKVPVKGFPRLTRMRPGQTRFTVIDTAGNNVVYVRRATEGDVSDSEAAEAYKKAGLTPLQRSLAVAARLRDFKNDDAAAAKALDVALARETDRSGPDFVRALEERIELAEALDEPDTTAALRAALREIKSSGAPGGP